MDDFPPREPPRFWIAMGLLVASLALAVVMSVVLTVTAHAQDKPLCAPADAFIRQMGEVKKQRPVWEGTIPIPDAPPAEALVIQSEKGEWSFFIIQEGRACLVATGVDAYPSIATDQEV